MFDKDYTFKGKHAKYVKDLTRIVDESTNMSIFKRNFDVYRVAPIIGFRYKRKSTIDNSTELEAKMSTQIIHRNRDTLMYAYKLITLLDEENEPDLDKRLDYVFRYDLDSYSLDTEELNKKEDLKNNPEFKELYEKEKIMEKNLQNFNEYVLGGVEVLYEKIIKNSEYTEDYLLNLREFLNDNDERNKSKYEDSEEVMRDAFKRSF